MAAKDQLNRNTEILTVDRIKEPPFFRVLMHNDNYTTVDFVVKVLVSVFRRSEAEAKQIMLHVHNRGVGVCGTYPRSVAETKVARVHRLAEQEGFPLRCSMERD